MGYRRLKIYFVAIVVGAFSAQGQTLVATIREIPDKSHVIVEDKAGARYWLGHVYVFHSENIGQTYGFDIVARKHIRAMYASGHTPSRATVNLPNATLDHIMKLHEGKGMYGFFSTPDGQEFEATLIHERPVTGQAIGHRYDLDAMDAYVATDIRPESPSPCSPSYRRMILVDLFPDGTHALFEDTREKIYVSFHRALLLTANDLGKTFDLDLLRKHLVKAVETDFLTPPRILEGEVVASLADHRIIVRTQKGTEVAILV